MTRERTCWTSTSKRWVSVWSFSGSRGTLPGGASPPRAVSRGFVPRVLQPPVDSSNGPSRPPWSRSRDRRTFGEAACAAARCGGSPSASPDTSIAMTLRTPRTTCSGLGELAPRTWAYEVYGDVLDLAAGLRDPRQLHGAQANTNTVPPVPRLHRRRARHRGGSGDRVPTGRGSPTPDPPGIRRDDTTRSTRAARSARNRDANIVSAVPTSGSGSPRPTSRSATAGGSGSSRGRRPGTTIRRASSRAPTPSTCRAS